MASRVASIVELSSRDDPAGADALRRIGDGGLAGVLVRGAFPRHAMAAVAERLADPSIARIQPHPDAQERHVGRLLQWAGADRRGYHAEARRFEATCATLFDGWPPYRPTIEACLGALAGGRRVSLARATSGDELGTSTIRIIDDGARLPLHFDNQQIPFEGYDDLRGRVDLTGLASFFLVIQRASGGGELVLYGRTWGPSDNDFSRPDLGAILVEDARQSERRVVPLEEGDLLVFGAGRILHEVTPVAGMTPRLTIGGFLAFGAEGDEVVYWA
jgi:hypothetical protein